MATGSRTNQFSYHPIHVSLNMSLSFRISLPYVRELILTCVFASVPRGSPTDKKTMNLEADFKNPTLAIFIGADFESTEKSDFQYLSFNLQGRNQASMYFTIICKSQFQ